MADELLEETWMAGICKLIIGALRMVDLTIINHCHGFDFRADQERAINVD